MIFWGVHRCVKLWWKPITGKVYKKQASQAHMDPNDTLSVLLAWSQCGACVVITWAWPSPTQASGNSKYLVCLVIPLSHLRLCIFQSERPNPLKIFWHTVSRLSKYSILCIAFCSPQWRDFGVCSSVAYNQLIAPVPLIWWKDQLRLKAFHSQESINNNNSQNNMR